MTFTQASPLDAFIPEGLHYDAPFEIWRMFPGNRALDMIDLILKYDPETPDEVDALGDFLWQNNLIGELIACDVNGKRTSARSANDLYRSPMEAMNAYIHYMDATHFLWKRANGSQFGSSPITKRGLCSSFFSLLLSYDCADVLLERRQRYDGTRGWAVIATVKNGSRHWQCAVADHDGMFRRSIPVDDMHTARHELSAICYELLDDCGKVALWPTQAEALKAITSMVSATVLRDVRIRRQTLNAVFVEMLNPSQRGERFRSWLTAVPGVIYRPFRHRLYELKSDGRLGIEIPSFIHYEDMGTTVSQAARVATLSANLPNGVESYGVMPVGVCGYQPPLNA